MLYMVVEGPFAFRSCELRALGVGMWDFHAGI